MDVLEVRKEKEKLENEAFEFLKAKFKEFEKKTGLSITDAAIEMFPNNCLCGREWSVIGVNIIVERI